MKTKITLFFLLFLSLLSEAQTYHPFPSDSARWNCGGVNSDATFVESNYYMQFISGDTILSGQTYHKLLETRESSHSVAGGGTTTTSFSNGYIGAYREDTLKRIYFFPNNDTIESLLFDFGLALGDTLSWSYNNPAFWGTINWISSIDSVLCGSQYHKRFNISADTTDPLENNYVSIIEGIGSTFGLFGLLRPPGEMSHTLYCFVERDTMKYSYSSFMTSCDEIVIGVSENTEMKQIVLFPNPSDGIIYLKTTFSGETFIRVSDVLGKTAYAENVFDYESTIDLSHLSPGVYFLRATSGSGFNQILKILLQ
ncbi:MAG: T9SS type A sorting domain-containing protein [Bacteroidota bacterium]|nr:T9SS type A sorting domain-containing protein [Bacteroidota bacterium]